MSKYVYAFGDGQADGDGSMKGLLGGKGANLAEMTSIGLPVPPGFTLTTDVCTAYYSNNQDYPDGLRDEVAKALVTLEQRMNKGFGSSDDPLLVSVRSGARASMPGMMDTVLNLGLNDQTIQGVIRQSNDPRFAYDSYRRFIQMYANVVKGMNGDAFAKKLAQKKEQQGVELDTELTAEDLKQLVSDFKVIYKKSLGEVFPEEPLQQLWEAIGAVFGSWMTPRAVTYRKLHAIPSDWGTAVTVQGMVFGNMGDDCATGVAFTRDPATGENYFYGEYLVNAQGEDVVAGIRTPQPINLVKHKEGDLPAMEEVMPDSYAQLVNIRETLEQHYKDMQDIEFTIEKGKLYMLQTRTG
ncbi:MAG: PEP/pyruvate-binding domain-containing protein, partial [Desulfuromusa sp.]|nr:PEP/pyruvate-binding domain-containing protein [Desulfuromusa sp.]